MTHLPDAEHKLEQQVNRALDDSLLDIDGETLSVLRQRREAALAHVESPRRSRLFWAIPSSIAVAVLVGLTTWQVSITPQQTPSDDAMDIVLSEDFDMLEELEFIEWMAHHENTI